MSRLCLPYWLALLVCLPSAFAGGQLESPPPGSVYREYTRTMFNNNSWRVTDPNATFVGDPSNSPSTYLPNANLNVNIADYTDVLSVQAIGDVWGGHVGTINKSVRFNGNPSVFLPDLTTTPGPGECYTHQFNPVWNVPTGHLQQGNNTFRASSGGQTCYNFNWGQWGWYTMTLRVYHSDNKPHPAGSIVSHSNGGTVTENDVIQVQASSAAGISRVEIFAYYYGHDTDGDGVFTDWHHSYHRSLSEGTMVPRNHVGTATATQGGLYQVTWDTSLVPDQSPGSVKLVARIRDNNGYWFVTDIVDDLSLARFGTSVKYYPPTGVQEHFWVRDGDVESSFFTIPASDDLGAATQATMMLSTWNGIDGQADPGQTHYTKVNGWFAPSYGLDHLYHFDKVNVPTGQLQNGTNTVTFFSNSSHHGVEILWPGPGMMVKYESSDPPSDPTGLTAMTLDDDRIQLDWNTNPEAGIPGYNVYRGTSSGFPLTPMNLIAGTVPDSEWTDSGLDESTTYFYRVTALASGNAESGSSNQVSATTAADTTPASLETAAAADANTVTARFSESVDAASAQDPTNYSLGRTMGGGPIFISTALLGADNRTVTLATDTLAEGSSYDLGAFVFDQASTPNLSNSTLSFVYTAGRIVYLPCDEGSGGTAADTSGSGNDGTLNGPTWSSSTGDGSAFALEFDGVDDFVDLGTFDVGGDQLTMAAWIQPDDFDIADARIASKADGTAAESHYWMLSTIEDGGDIRLRARVKTSGTTTTLIAPAGDLTPGAWTHVALVYDGLELRLYQDGVVLGSTPLTGMLSQNPAVGVALGNQPAGAGDKPFDGAIDDFRLFERALDDTELAVLAGLLVDCNANGVADDIDIAMGTSLDVDMDGVPDECLCDATTYCIAAANSASAGGAQIGFLGSVSISANDLTLRVTDSAHDEPGIFYFGQTAIEAPFGDGFRCIGGTTFRLPPILADDCCGVAEFAFDNSVPPASGQVASGTSWNFQWWYRDPAGAGVKGFNLSNGLALTFCP